MKKRVYYRGYGIVEIPEGASPEQIWAILDAKKASDSGEDLMPVFEQPRKPEEPGFLSQVAKNVKAGVAAIPGALINTAAALPEMIGAVTAGEPEAGPGYGANVGLHQLSAPMLDAAKFIRDNPVSRYLSEVPQDQKDDAGNPVIGRQIGDVAGQVAGMMIPGAAGMRGAKALSYILGASQQASQVQQDADRKRAAGMAIAPEDSAAAAVAAMPSAALDAINIGRIGRFLPGYAKHEALKQAAEISGQSYLRPALETGLSALGGAGVETGQQLAANAAIKSTYDPAQALDEGLMDNAIAGGGADAGLELINQILLRKTAKNIHARHQNKAAERARQVAPEVMPGDEEAIGIRSQMDGTPEVKYVQQRGPTRNEILDELSLGLYGKPLSELDAQRGMHLDRSYEDLRKMGMSDQEVIDHLTQPIDLAPEPVQRPTPGLPTALAPDAPPVRLTDEGAIDASAVQYPSFLDQIIAQEPALYERLQGQDVVNSLLANPSEPRGVTPNKPRPKPPVQNAILTDEGAIATDQQPTEIRREGIRPMPTREQIIAEATAARQQAEQLKAQRRAEADAIRLQKKQSQVIVPETGIANERDADARQRVSRELFGRNFDQLTPEQITEVDSYRAEGLGEAVQPQEIAEINEFADLPFSRDQYRSALEVGRAAGVNTKPVSMTAVAKQAKVNPEVATQIINHMVARGDAQLIDGKVIVDPTAMGPRYSLNTNTAPVKANTKDLGVKYLEKHSGYGNSWKTLNPNDIEKVSNLNRPDGVEIFRTRYWTAEGQPQGNIVPGKYYAAIPAENGKMNVVGKLEFDNPLRNNLDGGVLHLAVRPEFQKQGIGSALLSQGRNDGYSIKPVAGDLLSEDGARAINKANTQDTVIGRFSLEGRSQPTPSTNTVAAQRQLLEEGKQSELANSIFGEMQRLGVDDIVSTRLVDNLKVQPNAKGSYANQIISLAMAVQDPQAMKETLHHEAVHAMKAMGLFNDAEWNILQGALNPNSVLSDDERRQYGEIYGDRPDIIQEEAIARGLERYMSGQLSLDGPAKDIATQKMSTLQRIGNAFKSNNMQSPADVASAFKSGNIGRREGNYAINNAVANDQAGVDTERRISAEAGTTQDIPAVDAAKASEAVDPNSLSSMVTLDEEPENTPDVRLSLPQKPVNTFGKEVFAPPDERGGLRRALDEQSAVRGNSVIVNKSDRAFLPGARLATRIETIDKRAASEEASRFLKHRPIESAIAAIRNADQSRTFAANSLESGPLEIKGDGPFHGAIGVKEGSTRGAAAVINDAREKGQYDRLKYYIAAERAKRLRPQGKEKLITPQQEAEWLKYGKDPEVKKFADELKAYNDQMVDFLLQSEVIDKATADKFKQGYFMAFYREDPNTKAVASQKSSSLTTQPQFVELQGSDQLIADPIENLVKNTNMITEMAMNNVAKQRIIRDGLKLGFAKQLKKSETSPTAVHVNIKGKKVSFEITDPVMYRSISAVNEPLDFWMKVAKMPSDLLRTAVTKTPIFMPRNMLRDSQHIHSLGYTRAPFMNVFTDTQKAFSDTGTMKKLEDMGVLSGSIQGEGAIGTAQVIRNKVRHGDNPLTRAWKTYSDFIDRGEAVNRITVYDHVYNREFESEMKANGGDAKKAKQVAEAAAQYETREVLNFGRHGANKWVRFVNAMIPFQNARLQGIDVLYRALKEGRGLNPEQKKQAVTRLVAQSIISMLYTAAVAGTAAYQAATKEERRDNYIIPLGEGKDPLKIPIAYEFGFLSKIIPEIAMQEILKAQDGKDIMKAFSDFMVEGGGATAEFLGKTSKIIDVPQNVKPIFEASINKDLFRERDIEPMWMQKLNPKYRYDDSTSELAKAVANYLPEGSEVSPAKIDHVLKGYFGTMGTYAMDLIDFITSPDPVGKLQDIKAIAEEGKYSKLPLFSPLFQRQDGAAALVDAMEIRNRAERDANTLKMAIRQGADISDAEREKLRKGAEIAKQTSAYDQRMSQLNRMMQQTQALMRNGQLTPSEGRKTLEEIRRRKIELSQPIVERYKDAVK